MYPVLTLALAAATAATLAGDPPPQPPPPTSPDWIAYDGIMEKISEAFAYEYKGDYSEIQQQLDALAVRFPDSSAIGEAHRGYLDLLLQRKPEAVDALIAKLQQSPNASVRSIARAQVELTKARTQPMEMKFTALDGRPVDLAVLRGKVVLLDYWATWCKPCMEEMPNVKSAYEKYRERGFEVIGISLNDAKDRQKLIDCVAENKMPWPQYFDGKGWKNEYAERYAIRGIPATFLLDRTGKLVATELRGEQLHTEIERRLP